MARRVCDILVEHKPNPNECAFEEHYRQKNSCMGCPFMYKDREMTWWMRTLVDALAAANPLRGPK